ncbi:hypothetical protein ACLB1E_35390 [Escherichia coli]
MQRSQTKRVVRDTLKSFAEIGRPADAQDDGQPLGDVIASGSGWDGLKTLVAMATRRPPPWPTIRLIMCSTVITASADTLHACCACSICELRPLHCRFWKR